ncbi:MAG: protein-export chaperone SecB, partial [Deltaproteobacteria bacterium]|nr:protein-export chaperone SecB [Deltaproteobacteria bacterium]
MSQETLPAFSIQDTRLLSSHFDINRSFEPGPDIKVEVKITINHTWQQDSKVLQVSDVVEVSGDEAPFNLMIEYGGIFLFEGELTDTDEIRRIAEINCASILFPFAREVIAETTRRAGIGP